MINDFKKAWIIYQMIKKGKMEMEKAKDFVVEHKKEILCAAGLIFVYNLGFKRGYRTAENAVTYFVNEVAKHVPEVK